ncbi:MULTISPECIES: hypothetical protein [unclassified Curtobacterium]|uniref:hypothetical protein n=1 Tax=unclassified Curtobacterium TaxID=257496 RepID=UPI00380A47F3
MTEQHPGVEPARFRTPPGWPAPSAAWVERHRLAEPALGWVPAPSLPAAPQGWRFWELDRRAFAADRRSLVLVLVGLALVLVGIATVVAVSVLGGDLRGLAVLGLVPVVGGAAIAITSSVRRAVLRAAAADGVVAAARERRAAEPIDPEAAWGVPGALPFVEASGDERRSPVRRRDRIGVTVTAAATAVVTIVGAAVAVVPLVQETVGGGGQTLALGLQDDAPAPPTASASADPDTDPAPDTDPTTPPAPSTVAVDAVLEEGTALQADCSVAMAGRTDPAHCWAWSLTAPAACEAQVTARFGQDANGPATRTEKRFVSLSPGVPLSLVLRGGETIAGLDHPTCVGTAAARYPIGTYDAGVDLPDADFPAACDDWGCDGFIFDAEASCDQATIEVHVFDDVADHHSRDYVVVQPVADGTSTTHNEVFVPYDHGEQPADAEVSSVTCED